MPSSVQSKYSWETQYHSESQSQKSWAGSLRLKLREERPWTSAPPVSGLCLVEARLGQKSGRFLLLCLVIILYWPSFASWCWERKNCSLDSVWAVEDMLEIDKWEACMLNSAGVHTLYVVFENFMAYFSYLDIKNM